MAHSNVQSFLKCTTPTVRSQVLPKTSIRYLNDHWQMLEDRDTIECFTLEDLWDCYEEWSVYGAGAPIRVGGHDNVVQYYTPYLSAIQIYTRKDANLRNMRDDPYLESETDSTSSEYEEGRLSRSNSSGSNRMWDSEDSGTDQDTELRLKERFGKLYFQYFEKNGPHLRLPLKDMIDKLAEEYPGLNSLRSIDLSPASWMAVAWYPIYHIPAQRNPKEIYSAFLTYHTLSSSFQDNILTEGLKQERKIKESDVISLPPFGLATYRMQKQIWMNPEAVDHQKATSLLNAADSWLRQLEVYHPDFIFFVSRSM